MNLTEKLAFALSGGVDIVLYVLIVMSVVSIAIIIERLMAFSQIEKSIDMDVNNAKIALEKRLGILATFGNNAPFVGLFGTILGVMNSFKSMGSGDGVATKLIMVGISEALVATAMGLLVAIPSVAAYNYFVRRIRKISLQKGFE